MPDWFPEELACDFEIVLSILNKKAVDDSSWVYDMEYKYNLSAQSIAVPYRIYLPELSDEEIDRLTSVQKQIVFCIYTRSNNGFVREKYVRRLLVSDFSEWCIPYIVKLCDEYVVQIVQVIYDSLKDRDNADIIEFCRANKAQIRKSHSRMVSYWNEYYRYDEHILKRYVGRKLFKECFGYSGRQRNCRKRSGIV